MTAHTDVPHDRATLSPRNSALLAAEHARTAATHQAHAEYSETVRALRERFETELAEAAARLRAATQPAYREYNAAVVAAENLPD